MVNHHGVGVSKVIMCICLLEATPGWITQGFPHA